jgi:disulfide bond formation protein DsbB
MKSTSNFNKQFLGTALAIIIIVLVIIFFMMFATGNVQPAQALPQATPTSITVAATQAVIHAEMTKQAVEAEMAVLHLQRVQTANLFDLYMPRFLIILFVIVFGFEFIIYFRRHDQRGE